MIQEAMRESRRSKNAGPSARVMNRAAMAALGLCLTWRAPAAFASPAGLRAEIERFRRTETGGQLAFTAMFAPADGRGVAVDSCVACLGVNPDLPLVPASVAKLVTTTDALETFGPDHSFHTEFWIDGRLRNGVLEGNLVVRGGGDPFLVTERLWLLTEELERRGLRRVTGRLVIDTSGFLPEERDSARVVREDSDRPYAAGLSPLAVNFNSITLRLEPGRSAGAAGEAVLEPLDCGYLTLVNHLRTGTPRSKTAWSVRLSPRVAGAAPELRAAGSDAPSADDLGDDVGDDVGDEDVAASTANDSTELEASTDSLADSARGDAPDAAPTIEAAAPSPEVPSFGSSDHTRRQAYSDSLPVGEVITVSGRIRARAEAEYEYRSVEHPDAYSAAMLRSFLEESGLHIEGATTFGPTPKRAKLLLDFPSLPLSELVASANRHSNNFMADLFAMSLSSAPPTRPGSRATTVADALIPPASLTQGARLLTDWLEAEVGAGNRVVMKDGSGLSPSSRLTGDALLRVLRRAWNDLSVQPSLFASLPAPGEEGTLRRRFRGMETKPSLRAKTGTLGDARASSIAGYLDDPKQGTIAFVMMMNGKSAAWSVSEMQALQERWILRYLE